MSLKYLLGPVSKAFAEENLAGPRSSGDCLAFNEEGNLDLKISLVDRWDQVEARLPADWKPDYLALWLPAAALPRCLWTAPLVRIGLMPDWKGHWHAYRRLLRCCHGVFTDEAGAECLRQSGHPQAAVAVLPWPGDSFEPEAGDPAKLAAEHAERDGHGRDIDVLVLGDWSSAGKNGQAPCIERFARLGRRWRILIKHRLTADSYRKLVARSRIAFPSDEPHQGVARALAAAAAGTLVFQKKTNPELTSFLRDREESVYYGSDDGELERLLGHYLEHEEERERLAQAGQRRVAQWRLEEPGSELNRQVELIWPQLRAEPTANREMRTADVIVGRCLRARGKHDDPLLLAELVKELQSVEKTPHGDGESATKSLLAIAAGVALGHQTRGTGHAAAAAEVAAEYFRRTLDERPKCVLAGLNLAEALDAAGHKLSAIETARRTLEILSCKPDLDACDLEGLIFPRSETMQREWERAAWMHVGRWDDECWAKRALLGWRLHSLLAQSTGELCHYYEAALLRPDLPEGHAALGIALAKAGKVCEARPQLLKAVAGDPLDRSAARALCHTLTALGDSETRRTLIEDQRLLQRAAPEMVPLEPWFAEAPPKPGDLATLIVVCCNQLEFTRQCVESVLKHTRAPYELIVVDNGSTDETPGYLEEMRGRAGPARVEIIRNQVNRGHPGAVNQALLQARGRFVVFLDNDTVLTPGWLEGLIRVALQDWPRHGLVGPVTNGAPDVQAIRPGYRDVKDLDAFAEARRREFAGKTLMHGRLTSFCLLARHDVLDRVGNWDERFHPGFFVDDDLSVRAREAGYRLMVALDVYVHHFGHRTFASLGADSRAQLLENYRRFEEKWGKEYTAGYQMLAPADNGRPEPHAGERPSANQPSALQEETDSAIEAMHAGPPLKSGTDAPATVERPTLPGVSLCMIVKNEERHLPDCLASIQGIFDQIVVVDTGSTDRTRQIAEHFGAQVIDFPWVNSFAAARNECLRHARRQWVLWLDADDRLDPDNQGRLKRLLGTLGDERDAYAMKVRSVLDEDAKIFRLLDQVRLFRNLPEIRWDYRIHEQILPAVNRAGGAVRWADVIIDHVGYQQAEARKNKLERNLRLLEMDYGERPHDSFTLFNLGWTLLDLGRGQEALAHLKQALTHTQPSSSTLRKLYHLLTVAHRNQKLVEEALAICRQGLDRFPDDAELLFEKGMLLRDREDLLGVEQSWLRLLDMPRGQYFASEELGLRGFRTRHLLAEVYRAQERLIEAEVQWRAALQERLDFEPAWLSVAELYLKQSREADLEYLLEELEKAGIVPAKVGWLRARGLAQRKDFAAARRTLQAVIADDPRAAGPRVLYSQILLQEGRDWEAAERALRDVLALDPEHAESKHNLGILLRRLGRGNTAV